MEITMKSGVKQNVKYLVCFLCPTYLGGARLSRDGENFEEATEDNMPGSIYMELLNIDTERKMFKERFLDNKLVNLVIDVDNGTMVDWPEGLSAEICWKVVDQGLYIYLDEEQDKVWEFDGYVPDELSIDDEGYGDYVIMSVDGTGKIHNWGNVKDYIPDTLKYHFMDVA